MKRLQKQELRSNIVTTQIKKPISKQMMKGFLLLFGIVFLGVCIYLITRNSVTTYNAYQTLYSTETKTGIESSNYLSYRKGYLRYNQDGIEAVDPEGNILWNVSYHMQDPIVAICNNYVAVADRGNRQVYIMEGTGSSKEIEILHPIVDVEIASQGVIAVWADFNREDLIYLYGADGTLISEINTKVEKDGFPLDITLSKDGTKLLTSYLEMENSKMTSQVGFFNFGSVGQNYPNKMVGAETYGESIAPVLRFLDNERVAVFLDNGFVLYEMKQIPKEITRYLYEEPIKGIATSESYIGLLLEIAVGVNKLVVFDSSGNLKMEKMIEGEYGGFFISGEDVALYGTLNCVIYHVSGKEKLNTSFEKNVRFIFPVDNEDTYIFLGDTTTETVQLIQVDSTK